MHSGKILFHCVCGADIHVGEVESVVCSACGRRNVVKPGIASGSVETLVVSDTVTGHTRGTASEGIGESERLDLAGRVVDHFEVLEEIGSGGMGAVYRALDHALERYVALKVINREEILRKPAMVDAFMHEARAQARVNHPGIATIHYVGRFQGRPYFSMEWIPGGDLRTRLREGPLAFGEVVDIGLQAMAALEEAWRCGVTHRDIKPANLMLTPSGQLKITDFGLSKTERGGLHITGRKSLMGTPHYISPEQARGDSTDFRSDMYSLGATLFHLAYGRPPFEGDSFLDVVAKHLKEKVSIPAVPFSQVAPGFPAVIARMMAKDPEDRYASYEEAVETLQAIRPERQQAASLGQRAAAAALDWFTAWIVVTALLGVLSGILVALGGNDSNPQTPPAAGSLAFMRVLWAIGISVTFVLMVVGQVFFKTTIGKRVIGMRVVRIDGRSVERWRVAVRGCFQFHPLLLLAGYAFSYGVDGTVFLCLLTLPLVDFFWAAIDRCRRALHDLLLHTWVVKEV